MPSLIGTALSVAGMGLSAFGQIKQGQSEAAILEANARSADLEAKSIQEASKSEQLRLSRDRRQMVGKQASIMGGAGLDISSGSPLEVMAETVANYEQDIRQLGYTGDTKAAAKSFEGSIYDWMAPQKRRAGWLGAATTVGSGFGKMFLPTYS